MTVVTQKGNRLPFQLTRYSYAFRCIRSITKQDSNLRPHASKVDGLTTWPRRRYNMHLHRLVLYFVLMWVLLRLALLKLNKSFNYMLIITYSLFSLYHTCGNIGRLRIDWWIVSTDPQSDFYMYSFHCVWLLAFMQCKQWLIFDLFS